MQHKDAETVQSYIKTVTHAHWDAGRERCYRVHWELPEPETVEGEEDRTEAELAEVCFRKDANEVLMKDGSEALRLCIDQAEPLPIRGLFRYFLPFKLCCPSEDSSGVA